MIASARKIETDNLEAHSQFLSAEIADKEIILNQLVGRMQELHQQMPKVEEEKAALIKEKEEFYRERTLKDKELHDKEKNHGELIANLNTQLNVLKIKVKEKVKELFRLNNSCIEASKEIEFLKLEIEQLTQKTKDLADLVIHFEDLKEESRLLDIKKMQTELEISEKTSQATVDLKESKEQLATIRNEAQIKTMERDEAEYKLKAYTDQLYTSMNDYEIARKRLEEKWKMVFPELNIPLNL